MKSHVWRPLYVFLIIVAVILTVRVFYVPDDFGIHGEDGYMYGWYRAGNVDEWKAMPSRYRAGSDCTDCHFDKTEMATASMHGIIQCENCHGAGFDHPQDPPTLAIDRSREQCLRCHALLPYPGSDRGVLVGIENELHNPGMACVDCHNPHHPNLEDM